MPAKSTEPEQGPRKRAPRPKLDDGPDDDSQPESRALKDLRAEVERLRDSVEVYNEDVVQKISDFAKAVSLVSEGDAKDGEASSTRLLATMTRVANRVDTQCARFDALLAALAICDRLPSKRFDRLMREVRLLAAKELAEAPKSDAKPTPQWLVWTCWCGGMVLLVFALVGVFALCGVEF